MDGAFRRRLATTITARGFGAPRAHQASVLIVDASDFAADIHEAARLLDHDEVARAARFRFERDRITYVIAHAVWRTALGQCLGMEPENVPIVPTATGQPRLVGTAFSTSLSHGDRFVAIAVSPAATVGVDIEPFPTRSDLDALAPTFATTAELASLRALDGDERPRALLELWTRKEALLKAFGTGLLSDPSTTPAPADQWLLPPASAAHYPACRTRNLPSSGHWIAAIATPPGISDVCLHVF